MKTIRSRALLGAVVISIVATAATADQPQPRSETPLKPTVEGLQEQIRQLKADLASVQKQLDELQQQQEQQLEQAERDRLREAAAAAAAVAQHATDVDTTTSFVSGTRMQSQLNPEISVTGNLFAVAGSSEKERFSIGEWEVDIRSYLDPYSKVHLVLAKPEDEGIELEEGYVTWLNLGGHTALTAGKKRQQFGVLNRWHPHAYDQVDTPLVLTESFGHEGLKGTGLSLDWAVGSLWADANELTIEVMNGDNEVAFAGSDWKHPTFGARLKSYWDLTDDSYLEAGLNALHGKTDPDGRHNHDFYALDLTYNWYPAGRELYREVTFRGLLLHSDLELDDAITRAAWGGYLYGQMRLSPHWITGLRYDRVQDQRETGHTWWGLSPYLTLWQSEFVRLRGQFDYLDDNLYGADRRFTLQLTVAAGPHKHESY